MIQQHDTLDEMEDFAEQTHSSILYILLNIYGGAADEDMSFAASHVGVCSGMVTQLRGMAQLAAQVTTEAQGYLAVITIPLYRV